jgi:hypothetical protein
MDAPPGELLFGTGEHGENVSVKGRSDDAQRALKVHPKINYRGDIPTIVGI